MQKSQAAGPADALQAAGVLIRFEDLAALPVFPEFYRLIRRLFGVDIALVSRDGDRGRMLGAGLERNPFCRAVQKRPGGLARCRACDSAHAQRAVWEQRPLRYTCHAGLTEFLIPIEAGHGVIALLQCGQVLDRPPSPRDWAMLERRLAWAGGDGRDLRRAFARSKVLSRETQKDLMALLRLFAQEVALSQARLLLVEQDPRDRVIARALAFLKERFLDDVTLGQVAAAAGASVRNLVRLIRARTSATVLDHLHRLRIAHACDRLRQTHDKIGTIALACGFGSIQHFNRVFRKVLGMTPHRWRLQALGRSRTLPVS